MYSERSEEEGRITLVLTQAKENLEETAGLLERIDVFLETGYLAPKTDLELARAIGITLEQLGKVREYIITGRVCLDLGNCPLCSGWGRWDDILCGRCNGSGTIPPHAEQAEEH